MQRQRTLKLFALTTIVLTSYQYLALYIDSRWPNELLYSPSHFLGGMCVALATVYGMHFLRMRTSLVLALFSVLLIGIAWEIMEYATLVELSNIDTVSDIVADLFGGFVAYKLVTRA